MRLNEGIVMKQEILTITENIPVTESVWRMQMEAPGLEEQRPGGFVNIRLDGLFLRRPISVFDSAPGRLTILYKTVGRGTEQMTGLKPGAQLDVLTGLGNGYDLTKAGDTPLLLGGGVGVPPLYMLARKLRGEGKAVKVVLGFNTAAELFAEEEFRALGCNVTVTTADGSCGVKGFVTDALPEEYSYFYTCGPEPMLRAVYRATKTAGQFSFEERMGCGFGACMGCSCKTITGYKRICREGPVLEKEEILWDD
jgi:dihydroorotate dehydrogenase electron transfer subunit